MTFGELLDKERKEGCAEERNRFLALIDAMTADGRAADIPRLAKDVGFMEEMFAHYHINGDTGDAQKV